MPDLTTPTGDVDALVSHEWTSHPRSAHREHTYDSGCAICRGDVAAIVAVVAPLIAEQTRREERDRIAAQVREIAADSDWGHVNLRKFRSRHRRLVTGDSAVAVLLAVADEIETPGRETYPKETDRA